MQGSRTAIIIPTYNEKANISFLIKAIFKILPQVLMVVVDDNSPDGTAKSVEKLQSKYKNLELIEGKNKAGRGQAVLKGFEFVWRQTKRAVFVEMDADFSHQPQELPALIRAVGSKTVALASRYVRGGQVLNWPLRRKIFSFLANKIIGWLLSLPLKDNTNGFRAYPRQAITLVLKKSLVCKSYLLLSEVALVLHQKQFILKELPSVFPNRKSGQSNTNAQEIINNMLELFKLKLTYCSGF